MYQSRSRKRPRSASRESRELQITPTRHYDSSDSVSSYSYFCSDSDSDIGSECELDSEIDCDTSFESPASSYASSSTSPTAKRPRRDPAEGTEDAAASSSSSDLATPVEGRRTDDRAPALSAHRDEIVAAILTIVSALGLTKETLHVCVDLLDRYLLARSTKEAAPPCLETLSIACLWIAVKFIETPETIAKKHIKQILKRRRLSGNWTWQEILRQEGEVLSVLNFRLMAPTVLNTLQHKIHSDGQDLSAEQIQLAHYFADLLLLKHRANVFAKELLVDAIWFIVTGHQIAEVQAPLLAPVVILFLAHRDNINPKHAVFKTWFALRCQYGPFLQAPWQVPFDLTCECRVCEHTEKLNASATPTKASYVKPQPPVPAATCVHAS